MQQSTEDIKSLVWMQPVSEWRQGWHLAWLRPEGITSRVIYALAMALAFLVGIKVFSQASDLSSQAHPNAAEVSDSDPGLATGQEQKPSVMLFMENRGQVRDEMGNATPDILFAGQSAGCKIFLRANGLSYQFERTEYPEGYDPREKFMDLEKRMAMEEKTQHSTHRIDMRLLGANANPNVVRETENAYRENYYNAPAFPDGLVGVKSFERIRLENVYPNIDWVIYGTEKGIKYDFVIRPGGDPTQVRMDYSWADGVTLNRDGSLTLKTSLGEITEDAPVCYQEGREVKGHFVVDGSTVSLALSGYDPARTLVFDPSIVWATYYGGTVEETAVSTAVDASGNVYLAGWAQSTIDIASGGFQNTYGGGFYDAFLVKFSSSGSRTWSTYYGGTNLDTGQSIAIDASGNVFLAGQTSSTSSIASGGFQNTHGGATYDAFLVMFNSSGSRLWATYYGGTGNDYCESTAVDASGNVYLSGFTGSASGIASGGFQNTYGGNTEAFLVKFSPSGSRLWATYYGGSGVETGFSTAVDGSGNVYMSGYTTSTNSIASGGFQNTFGGGNGDAFLVKFSSSGSRLWATYYGGSGQEQAESIAFDGSGNVFLAGYTTSTTSIAFGGFQNTSGGNQDAFLVKFNSSGSRLWATYYGGPGDEWGQSTAVDAWGNVFLAGETNSTSGIASGGFQNTFGGGNGDAFLVKFSPSGTHSWATYYGNANSDACFPIATDASGNVYMAGWTNSTSGIASGGFQNTFGGNVDAFLVKIFDVLANAAPVALCQNITVVANGACQGTALVAQLDGGSNDPNGDPITLNVSPAGPYALGQTSVLLTVSDGNLSSTCSATVTVVDATAPNAICQNLTLTLDAQGNASTTASAIDNGSTDNCGPIMLQLSQTSFTCADLGTNTVTLTVTDAFANTSTCSATVNISAPAITASATADTTQCGYHISCNGAQDGIATAMAMGGCPGYIYLWSNGQTSATATALGAGSVSVTVTDAGGGTSVATISLTEPPALQIAINAVLGSCPNDSTGSAEISTIGGSACGGLSYLWSNGGTTQNLTNAPGGSYTVTVTDIQGCMATTTVIVPSFPAPSPTFTQAGNDLTAGQTWTTYQWLLNGSPISGANAATFTIIVSGSYSLQVTDSNGCSGISSSSIITGLRESLAGTQLSIYPNPARGVFHLRLESPLLCSGTMTIYDTYGKRILSETLPELDRETAFDIKGVPAGTYMVEVRTQSGPQRMFLLVVQ